MYLYLKILEYVDPAPATEVGWGAGEGVLLQVQVHQGDHEPQLYRKTRHAVCRQVKEGELEVGELHGNLLEVVPAQVQGAQVGQVSNLYGQVGNLVAGDVQLHQLVHLADLLGKGDKAVVVGNEALQLLQQTHRGGKVGQLVSAERERVGLV